MRTVVGLLVVLWFGITAAGQQKPPTPKNLKVRRVTTSSVSLSWDAVRGTNITYLIYRGPVIVGTVESNSFTDPTLQAGKAYIFSVAARDKNRNLSDRSSVVTVTTLKEDSGSPSPAPSVPMGLRAANVSTRSVTLSWEPSIVGGKAGLAGYRIYRGDDLIGAVTAESTAYRDESVRPKTAYKFRVSAFDKAGNESKKSEAVDVKTPAEEGR